MNDFQHAPHALALTLGIIALVSVLVVLETVLVPTLRSRGDAYAASARFLVMLSKTVVPLALLWKMQGLSVASLGWVQGGIFQAVWKGVVLAGGMAAFIFIYQKYSYLLFNKPYTSTGGSFLGQSVSGAVLGISISAALLNAFGEEIIFRGMLLPVLSRNLGIALALAVQSFVFTIYHLFPLQNSVLLFIMGVFFGLGYLWSGSLITPIFAHLIENGIPASVFLIRFFRDG